MKIFKINIARRGKEILLDHLRYKSAGKARANPVIPREPGSGEVAECGLESWESRALGSGVEAQRKLPALPWTPLALGAGRKRRSCEDPDGKPLTATPRGKRRHYRGED